MTKKVFAVVLALVVAASLATGCQPTEEPAQEEVTSQSSNAEKIQSNKEQDYSQLDLVQMKAPEEGAPIAIIETSMGNLYFQLYPELAPKAVENFTALAGKGVYDDSQFQPVVENFYIQGAVAPGQSVTSAFEDEDGQPQGFPVESTPSLWLFRGALAMRHTEDSTPLNFSNYFVVQSQLLSPELINQLESTGFPEEVQSIYAEYGGIPGYDTRYTVFGHLFSGYSVLDAIGQAPTDDQQAPLEEITVHRIWMDSYDSSLYPAYETPDTSGAMTSDEETAPADDAAPSEEPPEDTPEGDSTPEETQPV